MSDEERPREQMPLASGNGAIFAHLTERLGTNPRLFKERIGGAIMILEWAHQVEGTDVVTLATAGLERIPLWPRDRHEVTTTVLAPQAGAAFVALRDVVRSEVERNQRPWPVGAVWRSDEPVLQGTRISGGVMSLSGRGPEFDQIPDGDGSVALRTFTYLTAAEVARVDFDGTNALLDALQERPLEVYDVERAEDLFPAPGPGERQVPNTAVIVSAMVAEHPIGWAEVDEQGRVLAFTGREPDGYLNADTMQVWGARSLVHVAPGLRDFVIDAGPGECAWLEGGQWRFGRVDPR